MIVRPKNLLLFLIFESKSGMNNVNHWHTFYVSFPYYVAWHAAVRLMLNHRRHNGVHWVQRVLFVTGFKCKIGEEEKTM